LAKRRAVAIAVASEILAVAVAVSAVASE